ncbi:conserved hypothetical protein [Talaromyces stipitatus ATCC 10500]|uniref:Nucleoside phosphorylase domain-containing protein n=1 Tax=Talaromyces stipitatus (strain ATCC 10500 / CBS 375.48 / QM 6759 / NRRL 1006) TaxID=441959 RepID=B8LT17_TALSN|nr:uncharacterized protein TSTA_069450 [Talaromyces stipitatus ATCC 10500]EED23525.1 conserved hypothetical protein [Talaromyces stipitatus ATCC 10500]
MSPRPPLSHDDYTVACICPMSVEQAPVEALLDEIHPDLPTSRDKNNYTLGRIHRHNTVIAVLSDPGNSTVASVATQLLNDFRSIRFSLLIGIGGGVPDLDHDADIRLGDVVVSKPSGTFGGVVQFLRGKLLPEDRFERTGALQRPPDVLLASVARLETLHRRLDSEIPRYLEEMIQKYPKMRQGGYVHQGVENDKLFRAEFQHVAGNDCKSCNPDEAIEREPRLDLNTVIHYGTIGSSDAVIKDGQVRDKLRDDLKIQCVETEAAGLMASLPCLIIRGICDYADSHKNNRWQPYAAATAAAYAKELLSLVTTLDIPQCIQTTLHLGAVHNFLNEYVSGDVVGGDKFQDLAVRSIT